MSPLSKEVKFNAAVQVVNQLIVLKHEPTEIVELAVSIINNIEKKLDEKIGNSVNVVEKEDTESHV